MIFFGVTICVCALVVFFVSKKLYVNSDTWIYLFGYIYLFFGFFFGVLNYFLFRWFFSSDIFTDNFYFAYACWLVGFLLISFFLYRTNGVQFRFDVNFNPGASSLKLSVLASLLFSMFVILGSLMAFVKAGVIPMFASNVEEARSAMSAAGVLNQFVFLNIFSVVVCYIYFLYSKCPRSRLFLLVAISSSFIVMFGYGMRNYILVSVFGILFVREAVNNRKTSVVVVFFYAVFSIAILYFIGQLRSGYGNPEDFVQASMRLLSGTFSEFREWPFILDEFDVAFVNPVRYIYAFIPSKAFEAFYVDKNEVIFSSGLYYKELLNREFEGEGLGLRTSLYGDFYAMFGVLAFFILPIFYYGVLKIFFGRPSSPEKLCLVVCSALILFVGFSSELLTVILKLASLLFGFFVYRLIYSILRGACS